MGIQILHNVFKNKILMVKSFDFEKISNFAKDSNKPFKICKQVPSCTSFHDTILLFLNYFTLSKFIYLILNTE